MEDPTILIAYGVLAVVIVMLAVAVWALIDKGRKP